MRRWEWLAQLARENDWRIGAELGVKTGQTLFHLLDSCPGLSMIGVDLWEPQPILGEFGYNEWSHSDHEREVRLRARMYGVRASIIKDTTDRASHQIPDGSLDFVFIDACHETKQVMNDIENWRPKLREGGLLCGHDAGQESVKTALNRALMHSWHEAGHDGCWYA